MRLLICLQPCGSVEEVPDYQGDPSGDALLDYAVQKHRYEDGSEHIGNLVYIPERDWAKESIRTEVLRQIRKQGIGTRGLAESDPDYYAVKNTLVEDALKCFARHNRPEFCIDWMSKSKRIATPAEKEGVTQVKSAHRHLCEWCPVHSRVLTEKRKKYGAYDTKPKHRPGDIY